MKGKIQPHEEGNKERRLSTKLLRQIAQLTQHKYFYVFFLFCTAMRVMLRTEK